MYFFLLFVAKRGAIILVNNNFPSLSLFLSFEKGSQCHAIALELRTGG